MVKKHASAFASDFADRSKTLLDFVKATNRSGERVFSGWDEMLRVNKYTKIVTIVCRLKNRDPQTSKVDFIGWVESIKPDVDLSKQARSKYFSSETRNQRALEKLRQEGVKLGKKQGSVVTKARIAPAVEDGEAAFRYLRFKGALSDLSTTRDVTRDVGRHSVIGEKISRRSQRRKPI